MRTKGWCPSRCQAPCIQLLWDYRSTSGASVALERLYESATKRVCITSKRPTRFATASEGRFKGSIAPWRT